MKLALLTVNMAVLGRLLTPADFGLVALAVSVIGIAELFRDFGLSTAAIQAKELTAAQHSNLFWLNTVLGGILCVSVAALAPLVALAFRQPQMVGIVAVLSLVFLLNGLQTQFQAKLARDFRFNQLAGADVAAQLVGTSVGIAMAVLGAGVWSLVGMQLATSGAQLVLRVGLAHWFPGWYRKGQGIGHLVKFGLNLGASQVLGYVASNAATIVMGRLETATVLGYYTRAQQISTIPSNQVYFPLTNLIVSRMAKVHDKQVYKFETGRIAEISAIFGVSTFIFGATFAEPLVQALLGNQWGPSIIILQLLCIAGCFQSLTYGYYWMFLILNRTASLLRYNVVTKSALIVAVILGAVTYGGVGAAAAQAVVVFVSWPLCCAWLASDDRIDAIAHMMAGLKLIVVGSVASTFSLLARILLERLGVGELVGWGSGATIWFATWSIIMIALYRRTAIRILNRLSMRRLGN